MIAANATGEAPARRGRRPFRRAGLSRADRVVALAITLRRAEVVLEAGGAVAVPITAGLSGSSRRGHPFWTAVIHPRFLSLAGPATESGVETPQSKTASPCLDSRRGRLPATLLTHKSMGRSGFLLDREYACKWNEGLTQEANGRMEGAPRLAGVPRNLRVCVARSLSPCPTYRCTGSGRRVRLQWVPYSRRWQPRPQRPRGPRSGFHGMTPQAMLRARFSELAESLSVALSVRRKTGQFYCTVAGTSENTSTFMKSTFPAAWVTSGGGASIPTDSPLRKSSESFPVYKSIPRGCSRTRRRPCESPITSVMQAHLSNYRSSPTHLRREVAPMRRS